MSRSALLAGPSGGPTASSASGAGACGASAQGGPVCRAGLLALPDDLLIAICAAEPAALPSLRLTCTSLLRTASTAARRLSLRSTAGVPLSAFPCAKDVAVEDWAQGWAESWLEQLAQDLPAVESLRLGRLPPLTAGGVAPLARLPRLQRLEFHASLSEPALCLLCTLPLRLSTLSLRECCGLGDAALAGALRALPALREADLSMCCQLGDATLGALGGCASLEKLDLTGCERFSEAGLRQLAAAPIRTLLVSACSQLTDGCLAAIAGGLPRLACLGLFESGEEVTDEGLAHLAGLKSGLTGLDMGYSTWSHTSAGLAALLAQLPGLQMLNIGGCEGTTDDVVAAVAQHCKQLTMLDVSESQRVTAAGVRQLRQLEHLAELNLGWNIRLRDEWLQGLPPCLSRLDLSFCGELTDAALQHLGRRLPRLASVTLRKCGLLTDEGLHHLSYCTALTHLDLSYCGRVASLAPLRPLRHLASLVLVDATRALHPPGMALLAHLPALRSVEISGKRVDDGCMQALSHASQLTHLALSSSPLVTDRGLLALSRSRSLRSLSLDRCPQLGAGAVAQLQRRLPLLRVASARGRPSAASALEY